MGCGKILLVAAASIGAAMIGSASAQPYYPPPPPAYPQPEYRPPPPGFHCSAGFETSEGRRRIICPIRPRPIDSPCGCPTPPPPPGYPPYPPAHGHVIR
jgi:hypothetical protein